VRFILWSYHNPFTSCPSTLFWLVDMCVSQGSFLVV
jgi:hypothetical protein